MSSAASTPSHSHSHSARKSQRNSYYQSSSSSARARTSAPERDAQARNKDPWDDDDEDYSSDSSDDGRSPFRFIETYESKQKKREAAIILDSPDLLMMYAQARGDSIPGTRLFFMKQLCGYEDPPRATSTAPVQARSVSKEKAREKGKGGRKSTS